ncbi:uncharacterized protein LOC122372253 [Amphibalanus amphitrite]|uniref:uncharacterized protein LOC122372253 n=1 Tax=Amphibalanus amphitrite TaxID=1232801 RepID=UPI001C9292B9|nr:uncharacterized protein LOC122372253 [Amphibalanus amphitrite]
MRAQLACLSWYCLLTGVSAVRMIKTHFPSHVVMGKSMNMTCDYDPEGERVYQVKWYKDDNEFYTYIPGSSAKTYDTTGMNIDNIDMELSGAKSVVIHDVDLRMEGRYGCEITMDSSFDTVIGVGDVMIVALPQRGPNITGLFLDSMDEGDRVWANCTSYRSRPAAQLTWYINGARSDNASLRWYPEQVDPSGLRNVTLGLDFRLRGSHFGSTGLVMLKCTAEIETVFYQSANVRIVSRTMAMRSPFGKGSALALSGSSASLLLLLLLLGLRCLSGG